MSSATFQFQVEQTPVSNTSGWKRYRRHDCPVCGGAAKGCRQSRATKAIFCRSKLPVGQNGWGRVGDDKYGFGIYRDQAQTPQQQQAAILALEEYQQRERERLASLLPNDQRDRDYWRIARHSGLGTASRVELQRRGLTDIQINFAVAQGWLSDWVPGSGGNLGLSSGTAGVTPKTGKLCGFRGIAIFASDINGHLSGVQVRPEQAKIRDNFAKYVWASSASKGGNGPQLKSGNLPLFIFKHPDFNSTQPCNVEATEGSLKPLIHALRLWDNGNIQTIVIGAAGGNFAGLGEALSQLPKLISFTLHADAGAQDNPNLRRNYSQGIAQVPSGIDTALGWWGQSSKEQHKDIDELTLIERARIQRITVHEWLALNTDPATSITMERQGKVIGRAQWEATQTGQSWLDWDVHQTISRAISSLYTAVKPFKGFGSITKVPRGNTPDRVFRAGDRISVVEASVKRGWQYILDISGTGGRKSTESALISAERLKLDKLILLSEHPRNLTTHEAAERYTPVPVRFDKMIQDGTDPLGRPVARWPKAGEMPNIEGNCFQAPMFHLLASKGIEGILSGGNPICAGCSLAGACANKKGNGYGYLHEKRTLANTVYISSHAQSLSSPAAFDYTNSGFVWDEAGKILQFTKELTVTLQDFDHTMAVIEREHPEIHAALKPIRTAIRPFMEGSAEVPQYGFNTHALLEVLGEMPREIAALVPEIELIYAELDDLVFLQETDGVAHTKESRAITSLRGKLKRRSTRLNEAEQHLKALEVIQAKEYEEHEHLWSMTSYGSALQVEIETYLNGISQLRSEVGRLESELKKLDGERKAIKAISKSVERNTRWENRQQLALAVEKRWLVPFLHSWLRSDSDAIRSSLHISKAFTDDKGKVTPGRLTICQYQHRYADIAKSAKFNLFLDATLTCDRLAQMLDVDPSKILVIQQEETDLENQYRDLKVVQIVDLGKLGKQRREGLTKRVAALQTHLEHQHPNLAVIDHMARKPDYWWFNHSRGTNELRDRSALLSIGTPCENIGALERKYIALTGLVPQDEKDIKFQAYIHECIDNEFIQCAGRLRAILRREEELTYYVATDHPLPSEMGAEVVRACELTIEAGTPAEQQWSAISRYLLDCWRNDGKLPTQNEVAKALNVLQSQVSKLAKRFVGGWKSSLKKIFQTLLEIPNTDGIFFELDESIAALASEATQILEDYALEPPAKLLEMVMDLVDILGLAGWMQAIHNLDPGIRAMLLKNVLIGSVRKT